MRWGREFLPLSGTEFRSSSPWPRNCTAWATARVLRMLSTYFKVRKWKYRKYVLVPSNFCDIFSCITRRNYMKQETDWVHFMERWRTFQFTAEQHRRLGRTQPNIFFSHVRRAKYKRLSKFLHKLTTWHNFLISSKNLWCQIFLKCFNLCFCCQVRKIQFSAQLSFPLHYPNEALNSSSNI
jgi:hypothetical protein